MLSHLPWSAWPPDPPHQNNHFKKKKQKNIKVIWHEILATFKARTSSMLVCLLKHANHEFHETCHSVTFNVLVNSHQR